jgi:hypothetical protein
MVRKAVPTVRTINKQKPSVNVKSKGIASTHPMGPRVGMTYKGIKFQSPDMNSVNQPTRAYDIAHHDIVVGPPSTIIGGQHDLSGGDAFDMENISKILEGVKASTAPSTGTLNHADHGQRDIDSLELPGVVHVSTLMMYAMYAFDIPIECQHMVIHFKTQTAHGRAYEIVPISAMKDIMSHSTLMDVGGAPTRLDLAFGNIPFRASSSSLKSIASNYSSAEHSTLSAGDGGVMVDLVNASQPMSEAMAGIPVDFNLYSNRDAYRYVSLHRATVDLSSVNTIEVFSFTEIIKENSDSIGGELVNLISDTPTLEVFYAGFVEKFFPMIPMDAVKATILSGSIYSRYPYLNPGRSAVLNITNAYESIHALQAAQTLSLGEGGDVDFTSRLENVVFRQTIPTLQPNFLLDSFNSIRLGHAHSKTLKSPGRDIDSSDSLYVYRLNCWIDEYEKGFIKVLQDDNSQVEYIENFDKHELQRGGSLSSSFLEIKFSIDEMQSTIVIAPKSITYTLSLPATPDIEAFYSLLNICGNIVSGIGIDTPNRNNSVLVGSSEEFMMDMDHAASSEVFQDVVRNIDKYLGILDSRFVNVDTINNKIYMLPNAYMAIADSILGTALEAQNDFSYNLIDPEEIQEDLMVKWNNMVRRGRVVNIIPNTPVQTPPFIVLSTGLTKLSMKLPLMPETLRAEYRNLSPVVMTLVRNAVEPSRSKNLSSSVSRKDDDGDKLSSQGMSRIKILKENDPALFNPSGSKDLYSRKCQGDQQPIIVKKKINSSGSSSASKAQLDTDIKKGKILEYWNFTKGQTEYYGCDSKVFKFPKFLTNIHPKGFCLPCCKKKNIVDVNSKSRYLARHSKCLADVGKTMETSNFQKPRTKSKDEEVSVDPPHREYDEGDGMLDSRYVVKYSVRNPLEAGRIQQANPYIKKLLNDTIASKSSDVELMYLGVDQMFRTSRLPILHCVARALDMDITTLTSSMAAFLNSKTSSAMSWVRISKYLDQQQLVGLGENATTHNHGNKSSTMESPKDLAIWLNSEASISSLGSSAKYMPTSVAKDVVRVVLGLMGIIVIEFEEDEVTPGMTGGEEVDLVQDAVTSDLLAQHGHGGQGGAESEDQIVFISTRIIRESSGSARYSYPILRIDHRKFFSSGSIAQGTFPKSSSGGSTPRESGDQNRITVHAGDVLKILNANATHPLEFKRIDAWLSSQVKWGARGLVTSRAGEVWGVEIAKLTSRKSLVFVGIRPIAVDATSANRSALSTLPITMRRVDYGVEPKSQTAWIDMVEFVEDYNAYIRKYNQHSGGSHNHWHGDIVEKLDPLQVDAIYIRKQMGMTGPSSQHLHMQQFNEDSWLHPTDKYDIMGVSINGIVCQMNASVDGKALKNFHSRLHDTKVASTTGTHRTASLGQSLRYPAYVNMPISFYDLNIKQVQRVKTQRAKVDLEVSKYKFRLFEILMDVVITEMSKMHDSASRKVVASIVKSASSKASAVKELRLKYPEVEQSIRHCSHISKLEIWRQEVMKVISYEYYNMDSTFVEKSLDDPVKCRDTVTKILDQHVYTNGIKSWDDLQKVSESSERSRFVDESCLKNKSLSLHCKGHKTVVPTSSLECFKQLIVADLTNPFMRKQIIDYVMKGNYSKSFKGVRDFTFSEIHGEQIYAY